jgi:hypothetical protein
VIERLGGIGRFEQPARYSDAFENFAQFIGDLAFGNRMIAVSG